jgi:hypothetical protein
MAKEDEEKTAFITPCGVYCYVCLPFGLKNAGATFQRLMRKALGAQMGRNAEAYVDDIIVKTREGHTFIEDLEETFVNLRKVNIKPNPAKCAFGVPSGKLLGFLVSHCGIEANRDKVKAIEEMHPPRNLKEMQCLAGCMAALGCFIARSGEKALPFFKLTKCTGKFEWTPEPNKAFAKLKRYLTSPPIMVAPMTREPCYSISWQLQGLQVPFSSWSRTPRGSSRGRSILPARGLLTGKRPLCLPSLKRSRPRHLCRPSHPLRAMLQSLPRGSLPRVSSRCKRPCTSLAWYCMMRRNATPCSKSCSTPCSSLRGSYATTSRVTQSRW